MDIHDVVTVYTVSDPNQAEILRLALEAEGIMCRIDGEHQAGLTDMLQVGILVRAEDADRALKIIQSHEIYRGKHSE